MSSLLDVSPLREILNHLLTLQFPQYVSALFLQSPTSRLTARRAMLDSIDQIAASRTALGEIKNLVEALETKLRTLTAELDPTKEQLRVARGELDASKEEIKRLEVEARKWQERNTQLLTKVCLP